MGSLGAPEIPTIDISVFTSGGSLESREKTAKEFAQCCRHHGCVGITGHGVPTALLAESFNTAKKLFDLPLEDKMKAPHPDGVTPHRGYSATGREKGAGKAAADTDDQARKEQLSKITDYKESYEVGSEDNAEQYNIWLPESVFPGFRHFTTQLFWRLNETSMAILDVLIMSIELNEQEAAAIRKLHSGHNNQLRLLHYPPVPKEMLKHKDLTRLGEHADGSTFTLLFQSAHGGLEFANRETGDFMPATPKGDMLYLNIGDMFMRMSNGFYPSATHRVTIPDPSSQEDATPPRYSIPYFVHPDADGIVAPQPSRIIADQKALFEPTTFRNFADEMLKATQIRDS